MQLGSLLLETENCQQRKLAAIPHLLERHVGSDGPAELRGPSRDRRPGRD